MFTAVIIEPRIHPALELVLLNFNKNLDERWTFLIYHGNKNKELIETIIQKNNFEVRRKIELVPLHKDNLTIDQYNFLFYSPDFYDKIKTEMFLVFQTDTLLSDLHANNIYKFLEYDYVGAPWYNKNNDYEAVGNGGFSLRNKKKMLEMISMGNYTHPNGEPHYEDRFFSNTCGNVNNIVLHKPSFQIAKQFSVEQIFSTNSVGLHKPWAYLTNEQINELSKHFFDLKNLIHLHR